MKFGIVPKETGNTFPSVSRRVSVYHDVIFFIDSRRVSSFGVLASFLLVRREETGVPSFWSTALGKA